MCRDAARQRLTHAETRLSRLRRAIEAGAEPEALIESLNAAQAQRTAARAELSVLKDGPALLTDAEVYAMLDEIGDVGAALNRANPEKMRRLYENLRVEMVYDHDARAVDVTVRPLGGQCVCPRGIEPPRVAPLRTAGVHADDDSEVERIRHRIVRLLVDRFVPKHCGWALYLVVCAAQRTVGVRVRPWSSGSERVGWPSVGPSDCVLPYSAVADA